MQNIINTFHRERELSDEIINIIKEDSNLRKELVEHFRNNKNRHFAIYLLEVFEKIRGQEWPKNYEANIETLMLSSYILGLHKNVEDSLKIWKIKTIDFDAFCGLDIQLVVFNGVEETIEFLRFADTEESKEALKYIENCKLSGDFEDLDRYYCYDFMPWFV